MRSLKPVALALCLVPFAAVAQGVDCEQLRPQAELSKEREGKIRLGADTLYKIAKAEFVTEGKLREEIINLQRGVPVSEQTLLSLRTVYVFCGMVANAKDVSTERKVELYRLMLNVQSVPPTPKVRVKPIARKPVPKAIPASAPSSTCVSKRVEPDAQDSESTENRDGKKCDGRSPCSPDGNWWAYEAELKTTADAEQELRNWRLECVGKGCTHLETMSVSPSEHNRVVAMKVKTWSLPVTLRLVAERWTACPKPR